MLQTLFWIISIPIAAILLMFNIRRLLFLLAILPDSGPRKKISLLSETYLPP
jgi:hypothetical protein